MMVHFQPITRGERAMLVRPSAVRLVYAIVAVALVLSPGGAVWSAPGGDTQNILILNRSPGWQMDPVIQVGSPLRFVEPVYEGLVYYDSQAKVYKPSLAESWQVSKDGLEYVFALRRGVVFHDGTPFNAEAVKLSYDRAKTINQGIAFLLTPLKSVEVLDPYQVKITLTEPSPAFLYTTFKIKIVSPKAIKEHDVRGDWAQGWLHPRAVAKGPSA